MPVWSAIASGFLTGLFPIGLAEAAALGIGTLQPPARALALLGAFTVSHVAGKVPWYLLGASADRVTTRYPRAKAQVEKARSVMARHPVYGLGVLAAAAFASVPPFHLAAIAAGIARIPFGRFLLVCLLGRALRFGLIGSVPAIVRALLA
jgi:membrane protein YqaA with SNARE-associated domain